MTQRPPLYPLMPIVPLGLLASTAAASIDTWRRLHRLEQQLLHRQPDSRSTQQVLNDHLEQARSGDLDTDLARNYHHDVTLLTSFGTHRGHDGLRQLTRLLLDQAPQPTFHYHDVQVDGDIGFLRWTATGTDGTRLLDGADSYVIRDGKIVAQTIHYRTERAQ